MTEIEYSTFRSCGRTLSVGVVGNGSPLLLVPGTLQSADRWIDAGYVDALVGHHRLLLFDPLGHGRSEPSTRPDDYAPERLIEHLADALDHVGEEAAVVWGYSRGAQMAGQLARSRPGRVRALVYGGHVLFDAAAVLESLGRGPDLEMRAAAEKRAANGDWSAFWETFPVPIPEATKTKLQVGNDPAVQTAVSRGGRLDKVAWAPPPVPTVAYWGESEIFHALNLEEAESQPIDWFTISGGHAEAFSPCEPAVSGVTAFLDSQE